MSRADPLIVLGASFSNHTGISEKKTTIQVDTDRMTLGRFHPGDLPVRADIGALAECLSRVVEGVERPAVTEAVATRLETWRTEKERRASLRDDGGAGIRPVCSTCWAVSCLPMP